MLNKRSKQAQLNALETEMAKFLQELGYGT